MTTLLLIRHAENDYVGKRLAGRLPGVHLNDTGRHHALKLAAALCQGPIQAVYASPLERTMETAAPLAEAIKLPILPDPGLMEIDFGRWVGKTGKQMARTRLWKVIQGTPSQARFPCGESFVEAQQRIVAALDAIANAHDEGDLVACFSHSDAIKLALAHYLGLPLDNFQRLSVSPCSISTVHIPKEGSPHVAQVNQIIGFELRPSPKPKQREKPKKG